MKGVTSFQESTSMLILYSNRDILFIYLFIYLFIAVFFVVFVVFFSFLLIAWFKAKCTTHRNVILKNGSERSPLLHSDSDKTSVN